MPFKDFLGCFLGGGLVFSSKVQPGFNLVGLQSFYIQPCKPEGRLLDETSSKKQKLID